MSRKGGRVPVRPLPRGRSGARARDALDRRGDGDRGDFPTAFAKAERAAGRPLPSSRDGVPLRSGRGQARHRDIARRSPSSVSSSSPRPEPPAARRGRDTVGHVEKGAAIVDRIRTGRCDLVINTPQGSGARGDGYRIREAALSARIPCITTLSGAAAAVQAIADGRDEGALAAGAARVLQIERVGPSSRPSRSARTRCSASPRRAGRRRARAVLHAGGARPAAAAADEPLPRAAGRARLSDRPDRPGNAGALRARLRRRARGTRPARQRLPSWTSSGRSS